MRDMMQAQTGEFFADFIDFLIASLQESGISSEEAHETAIKASTHLSQNFSGETFYITRRPLEFARKMAIYADLQRMPSSDVDKKYGVSRGYSRVILRNIEQERRKRKRLKESVKIV